MKIEITKQVNVKMVVDIDFPYYYKYDLTDYDYESTSVIYGKITEIGEVRIHEKIRSKNNAVYEIEKNNRRDCYFEEKYKSTEEEYNKAKERAKHFFNVL